MIAIVGVVTLLACVLSTLWWTKHILRDTIPPRPLRHRQQGDMT